MRVIREQPGLTVRELAEATALHESYLYRLLPGLLHDGLAVKRDRGPVRCQAGG